MPLGDILYLHFKNDASHSIYSSPNFCYFRSLVSTCFALFLLLLLISQHRRLLMRCPQTPPPGAFSQNIPYVGPTQTSRSDSDAARISVTKTFGSPRTISLLPYRLFPRVRERDSQAVRQTSVSIEVFVKTGLTFVLAGTDGIVNKL